MPEISVIIPVYKIERYISQCIESVLSQTFQNLEIILVDDGSPDDSGKICDRYAELDKRIRVIHQKNAGLSCARNAGLKYSNGRYICFVDGDDLLDPDYCRTLDFLIKGDDYCFSACGVCRFPDGAVPIPQSDNTDPSVMGTVDYLKQQVDRKREFGVWNRLYRRDIFDRFLFYPGKIHEDVIFSTDLAADRRRVITTGRQLYYYRQRKNGIVAKAGERCSPDRIFAGEYLAEAARRSFPELYYQSLRYAVEYPWMFVDKIYVDRTFHENREFLDELRRFIRKYGPELQKVDAFDRIIRKRMSLFAKSPVLYGLNAYSRLARVYLYHVLKKDAYKDGHGI